MVFLKLANKTTQETELQGEVKKVQQKAQEYKHRQPNKSRLAKRTLNFMKAIDVRREYAA